MASSFIKRKIPWATQPPQPVGFDGGNAFGKSCVWACIPGWYEADANGTEIDAAASELGYIYSVGQRMRFYPTTSGTGSAHWIKIGTKAYGKGVGTARALELEQDSDITTLHYRRSVNDRGILFPDKSNLTILGIVKPKGDGVAGGTSDPRIFSKDEGADEVNHDLMFGLVNLASVVARLRVRIGTSTYTVAMNDSSANAVQEDALNLIAATLEPGGAGGTTKSRIHHLMEDGTYVTDADTDQTGEYNPRTTTDMGIGGKAFINDNEFEGDIIGVWAFDGAFQESDFRAFFANPWQVFEPQVQTIPIMYQAAEADSVVKRYVNPYSPPGGDGTTQNLIGVDRAYASLSEWEAARQRDLTWTSGDDTIEQVICEGDPGDPHNLTFFWTCESETFDAVDDYSAGDSTPTAFSNATVNSDVVFVGSNSIDTVDDTSYYHLDVTNGDIIDNAEGCMAAAFYIEENWIDAGGVLRAYDVSASGNRYQLTLEGDSGSGGLRFTTGNTGWGSVNVVTGPLGLLEGNWYIGVARWDVSNTTIKVEIYDSSGVLLGENEDAAVPSNYFPPANDIDRFVIGNEGGGGVVMHLDSVMASSNYDEPLQAYAGITSYLNFGKGSPSDNTRCDIDGWETDNAHYIDIKAGPKDRAGPKWNHARYNMRGGGSNPWYAIVMNEGSVRIDGLQVDICQTNRPSPSWNNVGISYNTLSDNGDEIIVRNCHLRYSGDPNVQYTANHQLIGFAPSQPGSANPPKFWIYNNVVAYELSGEYTDPDGHAAISVGHRDHYAYIYNNTIVGNWTDGVTGAATGEKDHSLYNNIIAGAENPVAPGSDYVRSLCNFNAASASSMGYNDADGVNDRVNQTFEFVQPFKVLAHDTFTVGVDTPLEDHVSESGHTWTQEDRGFDVETASGFLRLDSDTDNCAYLNMTPPSPDYIVNAVIKYSSGSPGYAASIMCRYDGAPYASRNGYEARVFSDEATWALYEVSNGSETLLGKGNIGEGNGTNSWSMILECKGSEITLKASDNGIVFTTIDTTHTAAGYAGICLQRNTFPGIYKISVTSSPDYTLKPVDTGAKGWGTRMIPESLGLDALSGTLRKYDAPDIGAFQSTSQKTIDFTRLPQGLLLSEAMPDLDWATTLYEPAEFRVVEGGIQGRWGYADTGFRHLGSISNTSAVVVKNPGIDNSGRLYLLVGTMIAVWDQGYKLRLGHDNTYWNGIIWYDAGGYAGAEDIANVTAYPINVDHELRFTVVDDGRGTVTLEYYIDGNLEASKVVVAANQHHHVGHPGLYMDSIGPEYLQSTIIKSWNDGPVPLVTAIL